jgi:hypothetical protein
MKTVALGIAASLVFLTLASAAQKDQTFTGEIMDSKCAKMGAHAEMMKNHENINTAKECTLLCVKQGANFVLFNALAQMTYQLEGQSKLSQFAGESVTVTGTFTDSNKTIHVSTVKLTPAKLPFPASDQPH